MSRKSLILKCCLLVVSLSTLLLLVLAAGSGGARGKTITVDDDGGGDYSKIQDAIHNAEDGDTIRVWEGTYEEHVVVNKTLSLVGNGSETTTIDGGGSGNVVQITVDWINMSGFSVTGSGSSDYPDYDSGIKVEANHSRLFNNNCLNNNYGISFDSSSDSTINNNTCNNNLFGIGLSFSSNCTISNNTCSENNEAGIYLSNSRDSTITNNTCSMNNGAGIELVSSNDNSLIDNICSDNKYGIYLTDSTDVTPSDNAFLGNEKDIQIGPESVEDDGNDFFKIVIFLIIIAWIFVSLVAAIRAW